ncbi:hypothetical protein TNCT_545061 [Trichonephila clavata]|uniref:Uncharacterized protein n=1 Tax=Trichonephila clavata TaxID=2740835 RepID=A0A8X6IM50_TRICU|nr:hypothetical protein TNCT_545061 [Trichonephila clavata]
MNCRASAERVSLLRLLAYRVSSFADRFMGWEISIIEDSCSVLRESGVPCPGQIIKKGNLCSTQDRHTAQGHQV